MIQCPGYGEYKNKEETSPEIANDPSQSVHIEEKYETRILRLFKNLRRRLPELLSLPHLQSATKLPPYLDTRKVQEALDRMIQSEVLNPGERIIKDEVRQSFQHGQKFGELNLVQAGITSPKGLAPYHKRTLSTLEGRNLAALKGITDESSKRIINTISDGLLAGRDYGEVTDELEDIIDNMSETRARVMVRTETMRAVNEGVRDRYQSMGIQMYERLEADDERTCTEWEFVIGDRSFNGCAEISGEQFTAEEAAEIDAQTHPNCRGTWVPVVEEVAWGTFEGEEEVQEQKVHVHGGEGSGNWGHAGRPGEVGGSAPGDSLPSGVYGSEKGKGVLPKLTSENRIQRKLDPDKVERASRKIKIMDAYKWAESNHSEKVIAEIVGGTTTPPHHPVDVLTEKWAIETKTVFPGAHEKMTMHGYNKDTGYNSLKEKRDFAVKVGLKGGSVMRVLATGKIYFKEGFGSFRSSAMQEVTSEQLARIIR